MSVWTKLQKVFIPPKLEDLTEAPGKIKQTLNKTKIKHVDVIFMDSDFQAADVIPGTIQFMGEIPIVKITTPELMGVFKVDGSTFFNRTTGKTTMLCTPNNPYGIDLRRDIASHAAILSLIEEQRKAGLLEKNEIKIPILIQHLPFNLVKKNLDYTFPGTPETIQRQINDEPQLNMPLLGILSDAKLARDVTDEDTSTVPVTLLIGIFIGMALLSLIQAAMAGG